VRQRGLTPAPSPIAYPLKIAARKACTASLLLSATLFTVAWKAQHHATREHGNVQADAATKAAAKTLLRYGTDLKGLAALATERPQNSLTWRSYADELASENMLSNLREIGLVQLLASLHSRQPIVANQLDSALALEISNAIAPSWNDRTFSFSVAEAQFFLKALVNAALVDSPSPLQMALREITATETTIPFYRRHALSRRGRDGRRDSNDGFRKSVFLHFNERPQITKIAAGRSGQAGTRASRWLFYLSGAAFLLGVALLGAICISIGKRIRPRHDRRRISDAYLKRVREIAQFGSYKIRISKDARQESNRWSEEMYSILRREPAQGPMPIGAYIAQYVHPEDRPFVTAICQKAIAGNSVAECEYRIILPGGEIRYMHDFLEHVSSDGTKKVFLGQMHDVTERHRMQQELDRTRTELRRSIAALESLRGKEQKRVAQEMHDDLGQLLAAMKIDLDDLGQSLPSHDTKMQQRLHALNDLLGAMIVSVRRIVADLQPKGLEDRGLFEALILMKQNFESRHRLPCHLKLPQEQPSLDRKIASAIYRTVQESLSNIVKHANATRITVELTVDGQHIFVCVTDNGKGLSPDASQKTDSFGLIGMRERTIALDGEMKLESREGCGTVVRVRLPQATPGERQ
jgi:signal transduction histidine kinase